MRPFVSFANSLYMIERQTHSKQHTLFNLVFIIRAAMFKCMSLVNIFVSYCQRCITEITRLARLKYLLINEGNSFNRLLQLKYWSDSLKHCSFWTPTFRFLWPFSGINNTFFSILNHLLDKKNIHLFNLSLLTVIS